MRSELIRFFDRWVGTFVCFVLTIFRKVREFFRRGKNICGGPHRILFLKLIEQGAMILAIPAIEEAKRLVGEENVFICVFKKNSYVLPVMKTIRKENIITIDTENVFTMGRDIIKFCLWCRKKGIDTVIDFEFFSRGSAILAYLSGAKIRVGMHGFLNDTPYRGDLMTHRVSYNPYIHTGLMYLLMVKALKEEPDDVPLLKIPVEADEFVLPRFTPSPEKLEKWRNYLTSHFSNLDEPIYVILNPNPNDLLKVRKWDIDNYIELAKKLIERYPKVRFVITGMEDEKKKLEVIEESVGKDKSINLAGNTDLEDLMTLYLICDVLITNDSGPAHFASTSPDIEIIVMFGPETPILFSPFGKNVNVIYKGLACSPCLNPYNYRFSFCEDNQCIKGITVEETFELVCRCIEKRLSKRG